MSDAAEYAVTWGMGGPGLTAHGMTLAEAREYAEPLRAWGPVIMRVHDGMVTYASGDDAWPLLESNVSVRCLLETVYGCGANQVAAAGMSGDAWKSDHSAGYQAGRDDRARCADARELAGYSVAFRYGYAAAWAWFADHDTRRPVLLMASGY